MAGFRRSKLPKNYIFKSTDKNKPNSFKYHIKKKVNKHCLTCLTLLFKSIDKNQIF